jgi:hypothetical protein
MSTLIITRSRELVNMASSYDIFVDGQKLGSLRNGKHVELKIQPGSHTLIARLDEYSSVPITVELEKGQVKRLTVKCFRFSSWILPAIAVVIPGFHYLHTEQGTPLALGALVIAPILAYAFYFYTKGKNRYLRITA